ncbi:hypothetical protein SAMN05660429_01457 [Thalassotalea agarivorans]|uniref:Uncharacterized protein n=2 Tax=Thalassotalea agarivorans TaxID=349064 RepID=A0A1I0DCY8_THASX|nr:hypothetical protein SAMN05660429_01457 [Thalassotalea agarivorans]
MALVNIKSVAFFVITVSLLANIYLISLVQKQEVTTSKSFVIIDKNELRCIETAKRTTFDKHQILGPDYLSNSYAVLLPDIKTNQDFTVEYSSCFYGNKSVATSIGDLQYEIDFYRQTQGVNHFGVFKSPYNDNYYLYTKPSFINDFE